jgi:uncharacterized protein (TIGR03437 family)
VVWAGAAPGLIGVMQLNVRVPAGFLPSGDQAVSLRIGTNFAQSGMSITIQ